jgi:hypothetical protein
MEKMVKGYHPFYFYHRNVKGIGYSLHFTLGNMTELILDFPELS